MVVPVSNYSLNFSKAASSVVSGNRGAIADSRFLQDNYGPGCYDVLLTGLEHDDYRVRAETVLLFSRLGVRKPAEIIERTQEVHGLLIRENEAGEVLSVERVTAQKRYWDPKMNFYPIPDSERFKNPNLVQNPAYKSSAKY